MTGLLFVVIGCTLELPDDGGDSREDGSGGTSTETVLPHEDTSAPTASAGPDTADTGADEYGVVTNVRITLPSEDFSTKVGEWFPVEFALVDDADELQDHRETSLAVTLDCSGTEQYVGGLDDIVGMMALPVGGALNPRPATVMLSSACEAGRLKGAMVAYNDTPPIEAYSEVFAVW